MSLYFKRFTPIGLILFLLIACEKPEGLGGNSSIKGKVIVESYDRDMRVQQATYPATDENVFIFYGNQSVVTDDIETGSDGSFEFNFLTKGDYRLVVYSEADSIPDDIPVEKKVSITKNNATVDAGQLIIHDLLDFDDGSAKISGRVRQVNWRNDFVEINDTTDAQNEDVFLVYENDDFVTERIRTREDGRFAFPNLIKGNYKLYVLSEDIYGWTEDVPKIREITIDQVHQEIDIGTLYIDQD